MILRRVLGVNISASSVGRIMKKLRFPRHRSALKSKKKRKLKEHYSEVGKDKQIDHMTVTKNSVVMKHFAGIERFREHVYANVYSKSNMALLINYRIKQYFFK